MARRVLPLLLLGAALLAWNTSFVSAPKVEGQLKLREGAILGLAGGLLTAEPAHAGGVFWDEIFPYSISISFAIIWGIILGFVLLRLQEAFPE